MGAGMGIGTSMAMVVVTVLVLILALAAQPIVLGNLGMSTSRVYSSSKARSDKAAVISCI